MRNNNKKLIVKSKLSFILALTVVLLASAILAGVLNTKYNDAQLQSELFVVQNQAVSTQANDVDMSEFATQLLCYNTFTS